MGVPGQRIGDLTVARLPAKARFPEQSNSMPGPVRRLSEGALYVELDSAKAPDGNSWGLAEGAKGGRVMNAGEGISPIRAPENIWRWRRRARAGSAYVICATGTAAGRVCRGASGSGRARISGELRGLPRQYARRRQLTPRRSRAPGSCRAGAAAPPRRSTSSFRRPCRSAMPGNPARHLCRYRGFPVEANGARPARPPDRQHQCRSFARSRTARFPPKCKRGSRDSTQRWRRRAPAAGTA